jgi:hypothetical protein
LANEHVVQHGTLFAAAEAERIVARQIGPPSFLGIAEEGILHSYTFTA